ncbi:MAG TPA: hypothetical protein VN904_01970 [Chthoniobacterales bacterium]|nr:hypothetical protein [Chthoniobacterales bacterium]
MQKLYSVSETVTQNLATNGDPGSCFDGRNNGGKTVVLLDHPRFLFHLRKDDREKFFDRDPNVDNDIPAVRKVRIEVVAIPWFGLTTLILILLISFWLA